MDCAWTTTFFYLGGIAQGKPLFMKSCFMTGFAELWIINFNRTKEQ